MYGVFCAVCMCVCVFVCQHRWAGASCSSSASCRGMCFQTAILVVDSRVVWCVCQCPSTSCFATGTTVLFRITELFGSQVTVDMSLAERVLFCRSQSNAGSAVMFLVFACVYVCARLSQQT